MTARRRPLAPGQRSTRQRDAIVEALRRADGFRTAQELHDELKTDHRVGLTTVYRNLQALTASGEVDALRKPDGESIYRLCDREDHHHHMVCRSCGLSIEVENVDFERWVSATAEAHGFSDVSHVATVYGLCRACGLGNV